MRKGGHRNHWRYLDRQGRRYIVFDIDATRQAARQRALPAIPSCLPQTSTRCGLCARLHRTQAREVVRTRTTALQMHTRQWVGTYAGRGNGDYRGELASALRAIATYLRHFALAPEVALVRLDGQYGDAAVIAQRDSRQASTWSRGGEGIKSWSIPSSNVRWLIHQQRGDQDEHR